MRLIPEDKIPAYKEHEAKADRIIETALSKEAAERVIIGALEFAVDMRKNATEDDETSIMTTKEDEDGIREQSDSPMVYDRIEIELGRWRDEGIHYKVDKIDGQEGMPQLEEANSRDDHNGALVWEPTEHPDFMRGNPIEIKQLPDDKAILNTYLNVSRTDSAGAAVRNEYEIKDGMVNAEKHIYKRGHTDEDYTKSRKANRHSHAAALRLAKIHAKRILKQRSEEDKAE